MKLTKAELGEQINSAIGLSLKESKEFVSCFFSQIKKELLAGQDVKISGFGTFEVHNKNARAGRNPQTGETVMISARQVISFHPNKEFRDQVKDAIPQSDAAGG